MEDESVFTIIIFKISIAQKKFWRKDSRGLQQPNKHMRKIAKLINYGSYKKYYNKRTVQKPMGSILSNTEQSMPQHFSYEETKDSVNHLNRILKQNQEELGFLLQFDIGSLKYNSSNWRQSIMPGSLLAKDSCNAKTYSLAINLRQFYKIYENMKHFELEDKKMQPSTITPSEEKECCICLEKAPTMVLPCTHEYCDKCTQKYIFESAEKKCPKCRHEFKCGRQTLQKEVYTVIEQQSIYEELKKTVLDLLSELNARQIEKVRKVLCMKANTGELIE